MVISVSNFIASCRQENARLSALQSENQDYEVGLLLPQKKQHHPWEVLNATGAPVVCAVLKDDEVLVRYTVYCCAYRLQHTPRSLDVQEHGSLSSLEQEVYTRGQIGDSVRSTCKLSRHCLTNCAQAASGVAALSLAVKLPTGEEIGGLPFGRCCVFPVPLPNDRVFVYEVCNRPISTTRLTI